MPIRRLERLIDPFRRMPDSKPPGDVWRFYAYFLREVWPVFGACWWSGWSAR